MPLPPPTPLSGPEAARLATALGIGALSLLAVAADHPESPPWRWAADAAVGLLLVVALRWRHRHPVAVALAAVLATAVCASALGPVLLAVVSLATRRRWPGIAVVGLAFVGAELVDTALTGTSLVWWAGPLFAVTLYGTCVGFGAYLGSRRELLVALRERAAAAEREQAVRVEQGRVAERTRIAREMHDVLAHRISLVAMHAGVLAFRRDLDPDEQARTAEVVRDNANLALVELRDVLGVLRADGPGDGSPAAPEPPQPRLDRLPDLVAEERAGGAPVRLDLDPGVARALADLPATTSRHAYRIAQEGLTNARKHAPGAPVRVAVEGSAGGLLTVTVRNGAPPAPAAAVPGSGLGTVGMTERVRLLGGRLDHGPDGDGGYRLRAVLPWPEPGA